MMMSHWAKNFTRVGRDGVTLARAIITVRHHQGVKPILLDQARQSNSVATSLLHVDKEVGLVRYYGLSGYIKRRLQSTSATSLTPGSSEDGSSLESVETTSTTSTTTSTAKIAFMVTASMKQDLSERLGYDAEQIKSMTPLQASLILNEAIQPDEMATKLPIAEQEYEQLVLVQQQQQQRQKEDDDNARIQAQEQPSSTIVADRSPTANMVPSPPTPLLSSSNTTQTFGLGEGYRSRNEYDISKHNKIGAFFSASEWYEVTETNAKGETSRVGLYQDQGEAELGLQTRQDIAEAKQTSLKFGMNRVDWMDLE